MSILFAPLTAYTTDAEADGGVLVSGSAFANIGQKFLSAANGDVFVYGAASADVIADGTCAADGAVVVHGGATVRINNVFWANETAGSVFVYGEAFAEMHSTAAPELGAYADGSVYVSCELGMAATLSADADSNVYVFGDAWCGPGAICDGSVFVSGEALETLEILTGDSATVVAYYPWMYGLGGGAYERVIDGLAAGGAALGAMQVHMLERIALGSEENSVFAGVSRSRDVLAAFGVDANVVYVLQRENLTLEALNNADYTALARVVESLLVGGGAFSLLDALSKTADALAAVAVADALLLATTADVVAMAAAADAVFTAIERVVDSGVLFATGRQSLSIFVRDSVVAADAPLSAADVIAHIRDGLGFFGTVRLDTGEYAAWAINTESSGVTKYTNYPFNSFANIGGRYFGMTSAGVHALDADDDDGEDINARLRVGMTDMGTRLLKGVTEAYVGFTSDNKLLLRTITPNPVTGEREAVNYQMRGIGNAATAPQRFETGKGVKAVDWDFELENIDGADFDLHSVEFLPVKMSRRTRS